MGPGTFSQVNEISEISGEAQVWTARWYLG